MTNQDKQYYYIYDPTTKQRIPVSDEVYNEFYRPIWNTFRKAHRHGCCSCPMRFVIINLDYYHKTGHPRYQGDIIKKARSVKNVNKVQRRI